MKYIKFSITIALLSVVGILIYYNVTNKTREEKQNQQINDNQVVAEVINRDLEKDYPVSARQVLKYYNEIQKCYYNYDCTDEEIEALAKKAYQLLDPDLLKVNPFDKFLENLKKDIMEYRQVGLKISNIILDKGEEVEIYPNYNATINSTYYLKDKNNNTSKVIQTYVLRKDDNKEWKIYGFKIYEPED